jgi:hypothetical protein
MGIDDIPDYIIKKCYPKIITALTHIINLSFATGKFPVANDRFIMCVKAVIILG